MITFALSTTTLVVRGRGGVTADIDAAAARMLLGVSWEEGGGGGDGAGGACVMAAVTQPCTQSRSCELWNHDMLCTCDVTRFDNGTTKRQCQMHDRTAATPRW
jgi:hypothetical protein